MRHHLNILFSYFERIRDKEKSFKEQIVVIYDRNRRFTSKDENIEFKVENLVIGDELLMFEWIPQKGGYTTGGYILTEIMDIADFTQRGNYIILKIRVKYSQGGMFYRD